MVTLQSMGVPVVPPVGTSWVVPPVGTSWVVPLSVAEPLLVVPLLLLLLLLLLVVVSSQQVRSLRSSGWHQS